MTTLEDQLAAREAELNELEKTGKPNLMSCKAAYGLNLNENLMHGYSYDPRKTNNPKHAFLLDKCMSHLGTYQQKKSELADESKRYREKRHEINHYINEVKTKINEEKIRQQQIVHNGQISEAVANQMQMHPKAEPKTIPNEIKIILPTAEAATIDQPAWDSQLYHGKDRWTWIFYLAVFAALALIILRRYY